jgi:hypothetical protein
MGQSNENAIEHGAFSFAESGGQYFSARSKIAFRAAQERPSATSIRIAEASQDGDQSERPHSRGRKQQRLNYRFPSNFS